MNRSLLSRLFFAVACSWLMSGCDEEEFIITCDDDLSCVFEDRKGVVCVYDGSTGKYCAYEVFGCPTGLRWFEYAPKHLRGNCVTPEMLVRDGGSDILNTD